jgi:phage shock protein E
MKLDLEILLMGLRSLLGLGEKKRVVISYLERNARIIDLRPKEAFDMSTIPNAENIEMDYVSEHVERIRAMAPVVLCCNSGFKSDEVAVYLRKEGIDAINGGSWRRVMKIINA